MLDRQKGRKPRDPLIAKSFNTYRLASVKEEVIGLIARVARLGVETVRITEQMRIATR